MKKLILTLPVLALSLTTLSPASAQTTLTQFTFETNTPPDSTGTTAGPFSSDAGLLTATLTSQHAAAATAYSTPAGNGSANSFSSNNWAIGDFYQVTLPNTTGFAGLSLSFAASSSNTGPRDFNLQYSTDGSNYLNFTTYTVINAAFAAGTPSTDPNAVKSFDLSAITGLDNSASPISFRLTNASTVSVTGGTVATTGTSRIDDFTVTAVPEPSTYALIGGGLGLLVLLQRRRRSALAA